MCDFRINLEERMLSFGKEVSGLRKGLETGGLSGFELDRLGNDHLEAVSAIFEEVKENLDFQLAARKYAGKLEKLITRMNERQMAGLEVYGKITTLSARLEIVDSPLIGRKRKKMEGGQGLYSIGLSSRPGRGSRRA